MKKIITDVDGVLLDWNKKFNSWMEDEGFVVSNPESYVIHKRYDINREQANGLVKDFNESVWLSHLDYWNDSQQGVETLCKAGFVFDICTAVGNNEFVQESRNRHLKYSFGKNTFDKMHYVGNDAPKDHILKQYKDTGIFWLEDKVENAVAGLKYGLKPILISHPWNTWFEHKEVTRVDSWQQICEIILNE